MRCKIDLKKIVRVTWKEPRKIPISHRVVDQLSPHHDSQFSAFSTEVLNQVNRKHNRSSSPFTTLADRVERKVASTGAGQPNYWPKTWFGADAWYVSNVSIIFYYSMLYYLMFWTLLGFIIHFNIIFGTNLLTGGPAQNCCFLPVLGFRRKGISNGVQTEWNLRKRDLLMR